MQQFCDAPGAQSLLKELRAVRTELAGWYQAAGSMRYSDWNQRYIELTDRKEQIEQKLHSFNKQLCAGDVMDNGTLQSLGAKLSANEALVDIYRYYNYPHNAWCYAAAVILPGRAALVDLGSATAIDDVILRQWRPAVIAGEDGDSEWQRLTNSIWQPIVAQLQPATKRIYLCPDGALSGIPWQLFLPARPGTLLCQVDSPRELLLLKQQATAAEEQSSLVLAGGVNFDSLLGGKLVKPKDPPFQVQSLPGTVAELQDITRLATTRNLKLTAFTGDNATKDSIVAAMPNASFVHLSTHGFFFDSDFIKAVFDTGNGGAPERGIAISQRQRRPVGDEHRNPLVESGLLLAGANNRDPQTGTTPGVLTAEELVGIDLSKCRLVTLSACETGLGRNNVAGQGVIGLRSALLAAGAECVLLSLWKVPVAPTIKLMTEFYNNLWLKKLPPAQALASAQAVLRNDPRWGDKPYNWAAWVLVGKGW